MKNFLPSKIAQTLLVFAIVGLGLFIVRSKFISGQIHNVIFITIDTCRADYLSCYGYEYQTTPNIDAVAEEGILFENVITPVPLTLPAHCSIFTGTTPLYHGVHDNINYKMDTSSITLAEVLQQDSFTTAAIVSASILDSKFGLDQGFQTYDDKFDEEFILSGTTERKGGEVTRHANSWLEKNKNERFFLFLHYYDPHYPWEPPEPFISAYPSSPYAGEVAYVDHCIGQVIDKLKKLGLYDSTLIIITSDHGESLEEHGEGTHGFFIYQSTLEIPLILKIPGLTKSLKIPERAGIIDIFPTVCSLLGIRIPPQIQGKDLSGYFFKKDLTRQDRTFYCESLVPTHYDCNPLLGIVSGDFKYIQTTRPELYDLKADPKELKDLADTLPQKAAIMQKRLKQSLNNLYNSQDVDSRITPDTKTMAQLKSLGYVAGAKIDDPLEFDPEKDDPKDMIEFHLLNATAEVLLHEGKFAEVDRICSKMLKIKPDYPETFQILGKLAFKKNQHEKAIKYLLRYLELDPEAFIGYNNIGLSYIKLNKVDEAIKYFEKGISVKPEISAEIYYNLTLALEMQARFDEALSNLQKAAQISPNDKRFESEIKNIRIVRENYNNLAKNLENKPGSADAHTKIAGFFYKLNSLELAAEHFREALKIRPDHYQSRSNLARSLLELNRRKEALEEYYLLLKAEPESVDTLNSIAWILATTNDPKISNPEHAVKLAQRACGLTKYKVPGTIDTLAAAYAANGKFIQAIETAQKAIELARSAGIKDLAEEIKQRQQLYRDGRPYHEP